MIPDGTATKRCCACGLTQPTNDFYADARRKDGLQPHCKVCQREDNRFQRVKRKALKQARRQAVAA